MLTNTQHPQTYRMQQNSAKSEFYINKKPTLEARQKSNKQKTKLVEGKKS